MDCQGFVIVIKITKSQPAEANSAPFFKGFKISIVQKDFAVRAINDE